MNQKCKENSFNPNLYNNTSAGFYWDKKTIDRFNNPLCLDSYGYKVYSQNDEDGILSEIFNRIGTTNKRFIEFGVENGLECNTHYLLLQGWSGLWIDGDDENYHQINKRFYTAIKTNKLLTYNDYVTCSNINNILAACNFSGEIDLLSIDIDGNDYHVWESIKEISPRVLTIEYNAKIPPNCEWVMSYDPTYIWDSSDKHGASLKSMEILSEMKGYQLVGTNISGVNAFFVRKDLINNNFYTPATSEHLYNPARFSLKFSNGHPSKQWLSNDPTDKSGKENLISLEHQTILSPELLESDSFEIISSIYKDMIITNRNTPIEIPITLKNNYNSSLKSSRDNINISYHIFNEKNDTIVFDGIRSPITFISALSTKQIVLKIDAFPQRGLYKLKPTLVQENIMWLDDFVISKPIYIEVK